MFPCPIEPAVCVTSNISGSWDCGAWSGSHWFQLEWPPAARCHHISFKELFAGLMSCAAWGGHWSGSCVQWQCDKSGSSSCCKQEILLRPRHDAPHLLPLLSGSVVQFEIVEAHLLADDLSRNRPSIFLSKALSPDCTLAVLPLELPELLLDHEGWTSPL